MRLLFVILFFLNPFFASAQKSSNNSSLINVDSGWANNSVNVVVFRKNSLVTYHDTQYISFYNKDKYVVLGKRKLGSSSWLIKRTPYKGNADDAHNSISIMVDGAGYLHLAWDHHNNPLHYCRSVSPGSLELTEEMAMTGKFEQSVTYPEFYKMPDGDLLFFYRNGESGQGNLNINKYNVATKQWIQLESNLIDGEGQRNAYWQACVGKNGTIHISWVWRESADVGSNHDICYARSTNGGKTWEKSTGEKYQLPITASTAEYAFRVPQNSELINQTSMVADNNDNFYIVTYYRELRDSVPQYHVLYKSSGRWVSQNPGFLKTVFSLTGVGTKRIPLSRPQMVVWQAGAICTAIIFRSEERGNKISAAISYDIFKNQWQINDLANEAVGSWEPTYDTELWKEKEIFNLFVEKAEQMDAEGKGDFASQMVKVLEVDFKK